MTIEFEKNISAAAPGLEVLLVEAEVDSLATSDALWAEIEAACAMIRDKYPMDQVRLRGAIDATRAA